VYRLSLLPDQRGIFSSSRVLLSGLVPACSLFCCETHGSEYDSVTGPFCSPTFFSVQASFHGRLRRSKTAPRTLFFFFNLPIPCIVVRQLQCYSPSFPPLLTAQEDVPLLYVTIGCLNFCPLYATLVSLFLFSSDAKLKTRPETATPLRYHPRSGGFFPPRLRRCCGNKFPCLTPPFLIQVVFNVAPRCKLTDEHFNPLSWNYRVPFSLLSPPVPI